ncbi:iron-containing alcohol dehydrogenase [Pseudomonas jessenii]|uniref:iron-containing alcohol dehydrogenase n=1 Tax=Pseudomonas jessenii TaxID=77298 RepID=UPI0038925002
MSNTGYFQYWMRSQVHCAVGAIVRVPALMQQLGGKRVLLVSDAGLRQAGLVDRMEEVFAVNRSGGQPLLVGVIDDIAPDASAASINKATAYARSVAADCIVALGGGSVLDAAKGIKYSLAHNLTDIQDVLLGGVRMETSPPSGPLGIPHIAVPTTSGTGAEVTNGAVILCDRLDGAKAGLVAPYLEADIAVLDPQLTLGLPRSITADTAMDALTHALEVVANPSSNHFTDASVFTASALINQWLPVVIEEPGNLEGRSALMQASTMACLALVNAWGPVPVHNCAHALGALFHIPHGRANGVLLPAVIDVLRDFYRPTAERLARALAIPAAGQSADQLLDQVVIRLRALQEKIGMPKTFPEVKREQVAQIVQAVSADPVAMFYRMSPAQIELIIDKVACD